MTIEEFKLEDRRLTALLAKADKEARKAQIEVNRIRVEFSKLWWGLEISCLVTNEMACHIHRGELYCVTQIDASYAVTYGKKPRKPWVTGRRLLDEKTSETKDTNLLSYWEVYES